MVPSVNPWTSSLERAAAEVRRFSQASVNHALCAQLAGRIEAAASMPLDEALRREIRGIARTLIDESPESGSIAPSFDEVLAGLHALERSER